jgi:hypothetical protein
MKMSSEQTPRVGEHVGVPWGLDTLEGVVVRTYETPSGTRAVVSLDVPGADDPEPRTVNLRAADLRPIDEANQADSPGSWVDEYRFTQAVMAALERIVEQLPTKPDIQTNVRVASHQADALLHLPEGLVIIEIKRAAPDAAAADQLSSFLNDAQRSNPEAPVAGLIVLQDQPSELVARELRLRGLAPIRWTTKRDDQRLAAALASAFEAA